MFGTHTPHTANNPPTTDRARLEARIGVLQNQIELVGAISLLQRCNLEDELKRILSQLAWLNEAGLDDLPRPPAPVQAIPEQALPDYINEETPVAPVIEPEPATPPVVYGDEAAQDNTEALEEWPQEELSEVVQAVTEETALSETAEPASEDMALAIETEAPTKLNPQEIVAALEEGLGNLSESLERIQLPNHPAAFPEPSQDDVQDYLETTTEIEVPADLALDKAMADTESNDPEAEPLPTEAPQAEALATELLLEQFPLEEGESAEADPDSLNLEGEDFLPTFLSSEVQLNLFGEAG